MTTAAVIGAGAAGLSAARHLLERGHDVTVFEAGSHIGGLWVHGNDNGLSVAYDSLHINTDTRMMEYRDYPMPKDIPAYPNHTQIHRYFCDYAKHFELYPHIRFETPLAHARRGGNGTWEITTKTGGVSSPGW